MLDKLGKYQIRSELGRGAMGIVYDGFDPFIERPVAIKTIQKSLFDKSELDDLLNRFRREAQAAGRLSHPNIVSIYEYGEESDIAYIAMEYVVGTELKDRFDKGERFQIGEVADIMRQLLDALEYSHDRGVVHRDIKPSNILIEKNGRIKIADFGIARIESSELTQAGTVLGTPSYMSPEQFMGREADRRSDIYSSGVILYQLLTGERPFTGSNMTIIMQKVLNQAPALPSSLNPEVSKALDEVVKKALSKRPDDRFHTAAAFATALKLATDIIAISERAQRPEATVKVNGPGQAQQAGDGLEISLQFNVSDIEKRLEESRKQAATGKREAFMPESQDDEDETTLVLAPNRSEVAEVAPKPKPESEQEEEGTLSSSSLLAGLAREAEAKLGEQESTAAQEQAKARKIHDALSYIVKFFTAFNKHVNGVEPEVRRSYSLDARTIYDHLKWQRAVIDFRKQDLSDAALLAHATFAVNYCAPEPVVLKRPWSQFDATKNELNYLNLRSLDDLDAIRKRPTTEWLETRLEPAFPVQLRFQGNYKENCIDVMGRNLGSFGVTAFRLVPEDVTPKMMDELGLFLLGRSSKLPAVLSPVNK